MKSGKGEDDSGEPGSSVRRTSHKVRRPSEAVIGQGVWYDPEAPLPCRVPTMLELSDAERAELEGWSRRKTAQALALRARIVLRAAAGLSNAVTAGELGITPHMLGRWRERFAHQRTDGLFDEPRPGAP